MTSLSDAAQANNGLKNTGGNEFESAVRNADNLGEG